MTARAAWKFTMYLQDNQDYVQEGPDDTDVFSDQGSIFKLYKSDFQITVTQSFC